MDVYIYNASLYCGDCGDKTKAELDDKGECDTGDSDDYPQGPYADGGGEADSPQHCNDCQVFLKNPLTSDGLDVVFQTVAESLTTGGGGVAVVREWATFYGVTIQDIVNESSISLDDILAEAEALQERLAKSQAVVTAFEYSRKELAPPQGPIPLTGKLAEALIAWQAPSPDEDLVNWLKS